MKAALLFTILVAAFVWGNAFLARHDDEDL